MLLTDVRKHGSEIVGHLLGMKVLANSVHGSATEVFNVQPLFWALELLFNLPALVIEVFEYFRRILFFVQQIGDENFSFCF